MASDGFAELVKRAQEGSAEAAERLLADYGDAIQREIRFCLLDQRLRRVVGESDVFQSVVAQFLGKLREGRYHFDAPGDLVGLLKTLARSHVARVARFWHAQRRDLRRDSGVNANEIVDKPTGGSTDSSVIARTDLLENALARLPERDRQILDWRQDDIGWPEIARRLSANNMDTLRRQHQRAVARVAGVFADQ